METIVSFKNFTFKYRNLDEPTLKNINLDINKGERVLIAGPSGCGKSTLAHCINGLIPFSYEGEINGKLIVNGVEPYKKSIFYMSKFVGTILQDQDAQFIGLSVGEDVAFALENEMVPQSEMKLKVKSALKRVGMLLHINKNPHQISGGQKQRVSLAGVLGNDTEILLFDEPLANLDPYSCKKTMEIIDKINNETGKTIIVIEHRVEDCLSQRFDKLVVMDRGSIIHCGSPDEVLASGILAKCGVREPLYVEAIRKANCKIEPKDKVSKIDNIDNKKFKDGILTWYSKYEFKQPKTKDKVLLWFDNVRFSYDNKTEVVKGVSFKLHEGEIISILGNNGAGKSTISNLITGINTPTSGNIFFNNQNINNWSIRKRGQYIGYIMQNPNHMITQNMIKDEVALGLKSKNLSQREIDSKVEYILKVCGLYEYRNWPVSALSYGQKKRVTIASILIMNPKILILDEPTAGQDYKHYTDFMEFIKSLSDKGISIILITHDMYLAMEYTDRAVVISDGVKIADDRVSNILTNDKIISKANLNETSLSKAAKILGISEPNNFVQYFIEYERKIKNNEGFRNAVC